MKNNCLFWDFHCLRWAVDVVWDEGDEISIAERETRSRSLSQLYIFIFFPSFQTQSRRKKERKKTIRRQTRAKQLDGKFNNFQFSKILITTMLLICKSGSALWCSLKSLLEHSRHIFPTQQKAFSACKLNICSRDCQKTELRPQTSCLERHRIVVFFDYGISHSQWCLNIYFSDFHSQLNRLCLRLPRRKCFSREKEVFMTWMAPFNVYLSKTVI